MAEPGSIKSRIAALNIEQVHVPAPNSRPAYTYDQATSAKKKPPPPPPPPGQRPPIPPRVQTVNNPPILTNAPTSTRHLGNQPAPVKPETPNRTPTLPPRPPPRSNSKPPSLPPRTPSCPSDRGLTKKASMESISTVSSGISTLSLGSAMTGRSNGTSNGGQRYEIRAPAYDPTKLPPLPTKKVLEDSKQNKQNNSILRAMRSTSNVATTSRAPPPQLPSRPALPARPESKTVEPEPPRRALPPPPSAFTFALNKSTETPPPIPATRPSPTSATEAGAPPPIPLASRPKLDAIMASKPKPGAQGCCLVCRDFSAPDGHAAQFPRTSLPSSDVGWLATQLTAPFPSATDKARAIFVWLHHNVDYDVHSFFNGTVSGTTPERTITSGLAVCEGYAGLFAALALKAGLECVVVSGHGKGFGHNALKPGDPLPPFKCGHAWNAVRIDNGEWKLCDPCWGAGNVSGKNYNRKFKPSEFTKSNDDFGYKHFPSDKAYFFRSDGRPLTWEEYMMDDMGERVMAYGTASDEGIRVRSIQPPMKHIKVRDPQEPVVRFQFSAVCQHWDNERHGAGKPYLLTLSVGGQNGRDSHHIPFNTDGKVWWLDVNRFELGAPGQKINVCAVTKFDGRDGRGLTLDQWKAKQGRVGQSWSYFCMWELV
ncbi:hypothetical protein K458DRAFT_413535 [Lentithecium fluviatile CBS 122367]|uniref:Transglutaminase-like domain-containing protein n=1 Tax=Lentithecium fluviatile CBS 122367 TaxID=1168545 RepID=A0A6G1JG92_9PLEO|nr:hypothetical protein K458DRAFT_413535 [Lentithecium fluviatile CBS 122367]